jgi:hypothetical protein
MRRVGAIAAAAALTVVMASSVSAAPRSMFVGDFDVLVDGAVVGHITAKIRSVDYAASAGTYRFEGMGGFGEAPIGQADFYSNDEESGVWFKGLEIGHSTDGSMPGYNVFVGHFVDLVDPEATDYVEFFGQHIQGDGPTWTLSDLYQAGMDVGEGTFELHVR